MQGESIQQSSGNALGTWCAILTAGTGCTQNIITLHSGLLFTRSLRHSSRLCVLHVMQTYANTHRAHICVDLATSAQPRAQVAGHCKSNPSNQLRYTRSLSQVTFCTGLTPFAKSTRTAPIGDREHRERIEITLRASPQLETHPER